LDREQALDPLGDQVGAGKDGVEEHRMIWHRYVLYGQPVDGGVEMPEGVFRDDGRDLGAEARRDRVLVDDQAAARSLDAREDALAVPRGDRAQVEQLDAAGEAVGG